MGLLKLELRSHFVLVWLHSGCYAADAHIGAISVVRPSPFSSVFLHLLNAVKDLCSKPFVSDSSSISLYIWVLLWLARLDVAQGDVIF
jgi:hypothetical protein